MWMQDLSHSSSFSTIHAGVFYMVLSLPRKFPPCVNNHFYSNKGEIYIPKIWNDADLVEKCFQYFLW